MDVTQCPSAWDVAPACVCAAEAAVCPGWFFRPCEVAAGKRVKPPASHAGSDPAVATPPGGEAGPGDEQGPRGECANYTAAAESGGGGGGFVVEGWKPRGSGPSSQRLYKWARLCLRAQNWTEGNLLGSTRSRTSC